MLVQTSKNMLICVQGIDLQTPCLVLLTPLGSVKLHKNLRMWDNAKNSLHLKGSFSLFIVWFIAPYWAVNIQIARCDQ